MNATIADALASSSASARVGLWCEKYAHDVRRVVLHSMTWGKDVDLADDIVQETFLRAFVRYDKYTPGMYVNTDGTDNPRPWLFSLAYHILVDYARARKAKSRRCDLTSNYGHITDIDPVLKPVTAVTGSNASFEDIINMRDELYPALYRLYHIDQKLFDYVIRFYWLGYRQDEIAEVTNTTWAATHNTAARAKHVLKKLFMAAACTDN